MQCIMFSDAIPMVTKVVFPNITFTSAVLSDCWCWSVAVVLVVFENKQHSRSAIVFIITLIFKLLFKFTLISLLIRDSVLGMVRCHQRKCSRAYVQRYWYHIFYTYQSTAIYDQATLSFCVTLRYVILRKTHCTRPSTSPAGLAIQIRYFQLRKIKVKRD